MQNDEAGSSFPASLSFYTAMEPEKGSLWASKKLQKEEMMGAASVFRSRNLGKKSSCFFFCDASAV